METTSTNRQVHQRARQDTRPRKPTKRQEKPCATVNHRNGYLNYNFLPFEVGSYEELSDRQSIENDFYKSLLNVESLFGLSVNRFENLNYPLNLCQICADLEGQLQCLGVTDLLMVICDKSRSATITLSDEFPTNNTLYYIQIEPVYDLMMRKNKQDLCNLLVSIFAYLYQVVHVPAHFNDSSYLGSTYEMLEEWLEYECEDVDEDQLKANQDHFTHITYSGSFFQTQICSPSALSEFNRRISDFLPESDQERQIHELAKKFCTLYTDYPDQSIFDHIVESDQTLDDYFDNDRMQVDQYLSTLWSNTDFVFNELWDTVNNQLGEYSSIDDPYDLQFFDSPQKIIAKDERFVVRLFPLIGKLCEILDDLN